MIETILEQTEKVLKKSAPKKLDSPYLPQSYVGGKLRFLNLKIPDVRRALIEVENFEPMRQDSINEIYKIFKELFLKSDCFEIKILCLIWMTKNRKKLDLKRDLKKFVLEIDNWAVSDTLSNLLAYEIEKDFEFYKSDLKKWNQSKNPWLRRQSIVSLFYYQRMRKEFVEFDFAIGLVENLIFDEHMYVQKGVGWTLRELTQVYPKETILFLEKSISKLSPYAFTTSREKLSEKQKNHLKKIREQSKLK